MVDDTMSMFRSRTAENHRACKFLKFPASLDAATSNTCTIVYRGDSEPMGTPFLIFPSSP